MELCGRVTLDQRRTRWYYTIWYTTVTFTRLKLVAISLKCLTAVRFVFINFWISNWQKQIISVTVQNQIRSSTGNFTKPLYYYSLEGCSYFKSIWIFKNFLARVEIFQSFGRRFCYEADKSENTFPDRVIRNDRRK